MDVTKAPPLDAAAIRTGSASASQQSAASPSAGNAASPSAGNILALVDRLDIQPLDVVAALQILIAEVRSAVELPADSLTMQSPTQASRVLIELFLQAVPEVTDNPPIWVAALTRVELAFQAAIDRAVDAVAVWRDVPQFVVDAAKETRALVVSQLCDEPPNPMWLRLEWLGLAPRVERFWRRRRLARRGLTDPDSRSLREAEGDVGKLVEDKSQ
ncbi:MAG TPA: hypothetical protein VNR70_06610 [Steroidobacteraceae bacterium]|nr:hypothetical protein [Steroidobacteraceae bacterium]